ncbi:DUF2333 family protein [Kordiimonas sp. SCSIO 12610]|uniref:DUF2333 family protein n=1 Tax=Kordiimonas sp. SCSIO 12610 TaxID=2829597 RepID=UPI00210A489E|nr:DUF2333 family protein [Kordiimonas sp. SCSIO 12610]UTW55509.1 DUF2333 family protein [Kordiimonas sp. SCSIO 12610]
MFKELLIWVRERFAAFFAFFRAKLRVLWHWFTGWISSVSGGTWRRVLIAIPLVFFFYILIGMMFVNRIDDNLSPAVAPPPGGSNAVSLMAYLVNRETVEHNWTPNDPVFLPGWWVDNTPAFQKGMFGAFSRFSLELRDQLGRSRGSSAVDADLEKAAGNLAIEPERWVIESWLPTKASDHFYRDAAKDFITYNNRVSSGDAVFERRADNLRMTLERIASDLGASSAKIEKYIGDNAGGFVPDFGVDNVFYEVKGQVYAYTLLLKSLRVDFASVVEDRELAKVYDELLRSLEAAAVLNPTVVTNGAVDGIVANHLSIQGFYLLRARTQLKEVTNILLN